MTGKYGLFAWLVLSLLASSAQADEAGILERALDCQLQPGELSTLMAKLRASSPSFAKASAEYALPTVNVYTLDTPVSGYGYSSREVAIMPGRIVLAVPGVTVKDVAGKLNLKTDDFLPAARPIRDSVRIVAFTLHHPMLKGKTLVGCEYNSVEAAWPFR